MNSFDLTQDQYLECENLIEGVLYPVTKFMDEAQFNCVVNNMQLITGEVYTIPIVLDITKEKAKEMSHQVKVELRFMNELVGYLYPESFFECNRQEVAIVGFQTRNIPHRAHEYLLRLALEISDGLFIQPLLGKKKSGDFTPEAILSGYGKLITEFLPTDRVVFSTLSTKMRYAGPREAIFHALIRKNFGCTDFIIGRDQAGVGDWYGKYEAQQLAKTLESSLGIRILDLKGPYYCSKCEMIVTEKSCSSKHNIFLHEISGTYIRKLISVGEIPDSRFIRPEIVQSLQGMSVFVE